MNIRRQRTNEPVWKTTFWTPFTRNGFCLKRADSVSRCAHLTCDAWGVSVRLDVEVDDESLTVSGAWDVIVVRGRRMGAAYVGWGIVRLLDGEDEPGEGDQRLLR